MDRLHTFTAAMDALLARRPDEAEIIGQGSLLLRAHLLAHDDWLPAAMAQPHPQYYHQYLLYKDAQDRYSVSSFVWGPGQSTPLHDHTVWGLVGILRGGEVSQGYRRQPDGTLAPDGPARHLQPGEVCAVSPAIGDIHQVLNAYSDRVSVGIHVYGADICAIERRVYALDGSSKPFRSSYANA